MSRPPPSCWSVLFFYRMVLLAFLVLLLVRGAQQKYKKHFLGFDELCRGGEMQPTEHKPVESKKWFRSVGKSAKEKRGVKEEKKKKLVPGCFFDTWPACVSYFSM
uniref:Putative secreted protein n=1 Tax=Ixodes scapularis TaxID=6945 RepID=A0A4D5RE92_IXOSC